MEQLLTGLGLSGSAGLNAYLPLLILGVMQRLDVVELTDPYNTLGSPLVLGVLVILLIVEMGADKIPAVDSLNDVINTAIRPTAGAVLFASSTGDLQTSDPSILTAASVLMGFVSAGSVHAVKAMVRPGVTVTTGGFGNFIVSLIEDVISFFVSVFAIFIPFIILIFTVSFFAIVGWWWWDWKRTRHYFGKQSISAVRYY